LHVEHIFIDRCVGHRGCRDRRKRGLLCHYRGRR
jgi:hypothetical protein